MAIISTHDGVDNPFNQLCNDIRAGKKPYALHRTTFDEACAQGLYRRICQVRGLEWSVKAERDWAQALYDQYGQAADEELRVIPSNSGGAVLSRALLERRGDEVDIVRLEKSDDWKEVAESVRQAEIDIWCAINLLPLTQNLDESREHVLGMDFARSGDLSVITPLVIEQNMQRRLPFAVELRNIPHAQQRQILFYLLDCLPRFSAAWLDATGNGEYLAEAAYDRYGKRINPVKLSNAWYSEHMPPFIAALEDDALRIAKDSEMIDDLRALERIDGIIKLGKKRTGKDKNRHGDSAIALCLAYAASRADNVLPVEVAIEDSEDRFLDMAAYREY